MTYLSLKARLKLRAKLLISLIRRKLGLSYTHYLKSGDSISEAVMRAKPGDIIIVPAGEYKERL